MGLRSAVESSKSGPGGKSLVTQTSRRVDRVRMLSVVHPDTGTNCILGQVGGTS